MTPEPRLCSRRGPRSGPKKNRKKGSEDRGPDGLSGPRTVLAEATFTTAGITAFATPDQPPGGDDAAAGASEIAGAGRSKGHHHCGRPGLPMSSEPTRSTRAQNRI